jgi:hypothetical protein
VTGDKPLPRIPPMWVPLAELARWLWDRHGLTESEIGDVVVDLRRISMNFQVEDEIIWGWPGWTVDWEAGRARWKQDADGIDYPLEVSWAAVTDAVTRLRRHTDEPQKPRSPFDARKAKTLLAAKKVCGDWPDAPTEPVTRAYLLQTFSGVSNDPHRQIRRELWPDIRRGRRPKRRHGGLAGKKS